MRYLLIILLLATNFTHWMLPVSAQSTHPCAGLRSRIQWTDGSSNPVTLIDPSTITYEIVSRGQIRQVLWDANTGCILISSSIGLWAYPAEDLQTPPLPLKLSHSAVGRSTIINLLPDGTILGHATSLAYSTDGNLSARLVDAGSYVSSLQLLNRATGEVLAESQPDAHLKAPLQFTDDDQTILSIGDGTVSGWALDEQGLHEMFYVGQQRPLRNVYDYGFDRQGYYPALLLDNRVFLGQLDGSIQVWNTVSSTLEAEWQGHVAALSQLVLSPDQTLLASGSDDGSIRLWNVATGASQGILQSLEGHGAPINSLTFSPDGNQLVSGDYFGAIRLWDISHAEDQAILDTSHHNGLNDVAYRADGQTAVIAGSNGFLRIVNPTTGEELAHLDGHTGDVNSVAFSPDGTFVVSAGDDTTLRTWDTTTHLEKSCIEDFQWPVRDVTIDSQGDFLYATAWEQTVISEDLESNYAATWERLPTFGESVAVSPNGLIIAVGSWDGSVSFWVRDFNRFATEMPLVLIGQRGRINALAFSPDNRTLAAASEDGGVYLWDVTTPNAIFLGRMQGDTAGMNDVAFSPDGHLIIGVGVDVWIWDAHTYRERASLRGHRGQINALAIHPNGKSLLTVSDDGTLRTWQLDTSPELAANYHFSLPTEQELGVAPNKQRDVLAFDTDGTLIRASGIGDHVWLWQPETGSEIRFMREVDGGYESAPIFLSPNGQLLIAGNRLWNTATGFPIDFWQSWDYQGLSGPFSAGGNHIIDVGYNKIDIYDAVTGDMLASHQMDGEITNLFAATERPLLVIQTGQGNNDVVWDYETDTLPAELNNTSPVEGTLRILAMGDTLALDTATHLIDLRNGDAIAQLSPVIHPSAASFSPHDRWVTVGDFAVWNIATQTRRDDIQPPYGGELALLAFSPSDDMLYAVNVSGAIYRWRLE